MSKVCLLGAPLDTANMGVSALAVSFVKILHYIDKEINISFLVGAKKSGYKLIDIGEGPYNIKIVNYRMSPKAKLEENLFWILFLAFLYRFIPIMIFRRRIINGNSLLKEISESVFVGSIHGGDSFSDIYGIKKYFSATIPDIIVILLNKQLILLPQTYGPFKYNLAKKISSFIIKKSSMALCRDKNGPDVVREIIGNHNNLPRIFFCPDVAFFLHKNANIVIDKMHSNPIIGINVNGLMYNGGFNRKNMFGINLDYGNLINNIIQVFLIKSNADIILVPHNNAQRGNIESDLDACEVILQNIPKQYKGRVKIIEQKQTPSEIKGVISNCDFFIGSRMHACIAALSTGVPTIGIAYSKKFMGVFESIGADNLVIDACSVSSSNAIDLIWSHFENRVELRRLLELSVHNVHDTIIETFRDVASRMGECEE